MGSPRKDLEWVPVNSSNLEMVAFEAIAESTWEATAYEPVMSKKGGKGRASEYQHTGYEFSDVGTLHIIFNPRGRGRRHYAYADVPYSVYEALLAAPSKGKFFWAHFRPGGVDKYLFTEL